MINVPGRRYGKLVLVEVVKTIKYLGLTRNIWLCRCDCGNTKEINSQTLRPGKSKSCGCSQKEHARRLGKANTGKNGNSAKNTVIATYKSQMKRIGREWAITDDEAEQLFLGKCFYCGTLPAVIKITPSGSFTHGGIDRVDSLKGYVAGNVVSCCWPCNNMKGTVSKDFFLKHIQKINEYQETLAEVEENFKFNHV